MGYKKYFVIASVGASSLLSCKKDDPVPVDGGYDYFPIETGKYVIYDVDSIVHSEVSVNIDTFRYQIKEIIESHFTDNEGRLSQRIERYYRAADSLPWVIRDVWFSTRTGSRAEKVEENRRFVKLIFPPSEKAKWNGNAFNILGEQEYEMEDVHKKKKIGTLDFDSTVTVIQQDVSNLIEIRYAGEVFAKNTGMVYKEVIDAVLEPGKGGIKDGLEFRMTVRVSGKQ